MCIRDRVPSEQLGIVVLSNAAPIGIVEAISATFLDLAVAGESRMDWFNLYGEAFKDLMTPDYLNDIDPASPLVNPAPAHPTETYTGIYQNELYGPLWIEAGLTGLILRLGPDRSPYPLEHWSGDVFYFMPPGENALAPAQATFVVNPTGRADFVTIDYFDVQGQGTFRRVEPAR